MDSTPSVTHLGLCAGYGGIELGLKRAIPGLRTVALCEIEAFAIANLVSKMEAGLMDPAPIWPDLKTFPWESFRDRVDILTGGYPASHSVQPANAEAKTIQGTCGPTSQTAFDFSGLGAASLRTSRDISAWGCPTSSKTWQEWVIERRGAYSARLNAVHRTSGSGSSSWPTMTANEAKNSQGESQLKRTPPPSGRLCYWPTVQASEVRQGFQDRSRGMKGQQESLTTVVIKQSGPPVPANSNTPGSRPESWQTATVSTGAHRQKDGSMTDKLDQQVKSWATPQAQEAGAKVETLFTKNGDPAFPGQRAYRKTPSGKMVLQSQTINQQVEMVEKSWPTPASAGVTGGPTGLAGGAGNREKLAKMLPDAEARAMGCGKLNPRWVCTLMNVPVFWVKP